MTKSRKSPGTTDPAPRPPRRRKSPPADTAGVSPGPAAPDGPVFTPEEYEERDLDFETAFARLPVVLVLGGLRVRWVGPLVELALDGRLGDLAEAAYGYLESCGWIDLLNESRLVDGQPTPTYARAFARAARALAEAGTSAGPESDPEVWASWIAFEQRGLHGLVEGLATARGWER